MKMVCDCCDPNWCDGIKLLAAVFILGIALCCAYDYGSVDNPDWYIHHKKITEESGEEINAGYLGAPFQCECGYSPAIAHPSFKDCVEYYKRKYEECCNK